VLHLALALALSAPPGDPHPFAEDAERHGVELGKLKYEDEDGKPLTVEAFARYVNVEKRAFSTTKDDKAGTVTLQLMSAAFSQAVWAAMSKEAGVKLGTALPAFELKDLAGKTITDADLRGHDTVLSFFFGTCVPCIAEVPVLNQLAAKAKRADLRFLAVTFDSEAEARDYVAKHRLTWPTLYGANVIIEALGVDKFPTLVVTDSTGKVAAIHPNDGKNVALPALVAWLERAVGPLR
jgi:peroxiredoxin